MSVNTSEEKSTSNQVDAGVHQPHRMRLPGFVKDEDIGLGDAIKRVTYAVGIKPCGGCEQRAAALNRWMVFARRNR